MYIFMILPKLGKTYKKLMINEFQVKHFSRGFEMDDSGIFV